jgi:hypothetical protein
MGEVKKVLLATLFKSTLSMSGHETYIVTGCALNLEGLRNTVGLSSVASAAQPLSFYPI